MEAAFGIDLGTTNSCIAVIGEDGLPQVIKIWMTSLQLLLWYVMKMMVNVMWELKLNGV